MMTPSERQLLIAVADATTGAQMKIEYDQKIWDANYQDDALLLIQDKVDLLLAIGMEQIATEVADELGIPVEMAESQLPDMVIDAVKAHD